MKSNSKTIVEKTFKSSGYQCVILMTEMGHRCGYVAIPKTHKMGFIPYHKGSELLTKIFNNKDMGQSDVGKRGVIPLMMMSCSKDEDKLRSMTPEIFFDVHGSITFSEPSDKSDYPIKVDEEVFWYGFDCAHYNDTEEGGRSLEYCIAECESLAKQLKEVDEFQE